MIELHEAKTGKRVSFKARDVLRVYEYEHTSLPECNTYIILEQPDQKAKYVDGELSQIYSGITHLYVREAYDIVMVMVSL